MTVPVTIPRSHEWDVAHPAGGQLRVMMAWPEQPPPPAGHPVFCVLDAGIMFGTTVEAARLQAGRPAATGVRPAVIIGLDLPTRDPASRQRLYASPDAAAALLRLLDAAVLPQAADIAPLDRAGMALFGHSLAGLVPLHALLDGISPFNRLIAASPSLWWDEEALLHRARRFTGGAAGRSLLLTVGGLERAAALPVGTEATRVERVTARRMVENVHALAGILSPRMAVEIAEFPGENHGSSLPGAIARAITFGLGTPRA